MAKNKAKAEWVPARQDIIWINCSLQAGHEIRDMHPFLVLSTRHLNAQTSLVIGLPMTTPEYNTDNPFADKTGKVTAKAGKTSYLLCHQPKSAFLAMTVGLKYCNGSPRCARDDGEAIGR